MRTYVLFTFAIYGIGGTQIYARNKMLYMQNKGWQTCMVTTEPGTEILVKEMSPYTNGVFPELMLNPYVYTPWKRRKIITRVIEYIRCFAPEGSEIVIESNFMAITPWAELIAAKLNAQNFIFLIQEDYNLKSKKILDFFSYKYDRRELAVNTPEALSILFKNYREIPDDEHRFLNAFCSNTVENCSSILENVLIDADYNIGSIGRLNKPFVLPMIKDVIKYVQQHPRLKYNFIFFGGSPYPEDIESIRQACKKVDNFNLIITGPLFPVPLCDIQKMDVCISSAGACWSSSNAGVLTISIDAMDFKPIGVIDITTNNCIHRGDSEIIPLGDLLDDILLNHRFVNELKVKMEDYFHIFEIHEELRHKATNIREYYNVKNTAPKMSVRFASMFAGAKATKKIAYIISKVISRVNR